MKKTFLLTLAAIIIFASCKKDPVTEPTAPSLKGRWNVVSNHYKDYENNVLLDEYTIPGNGAIFDFQNNGNLVISHDGLVETQPYTIKPDSKVDCGGYLSEIRNLTATSVTLYTRNDISPGNYDEIETNLQRIR